jgi:hypothetical protein
MELGGSENYLNPAYYNPNFSLCQYFFNPANSYKTKIAPRAIVRSWDSCFSLVYGRDFIFLVQIARDLYKRVFVHAEM